MAAFTLRHMEPVLNPDDQRVGVRAVLRTLSNRDLARAESVATWLKHHFDEGERRLLTGVLAARHELSPFSRFSRGMKAASGCVPESHADASTGMQRMLAG